MDMPKMREILFAAFNTGVLHPTELEYTCCYDSVNLANKILFILNNSESSGVLIRELSDELHLTQNIIRCYLRVLAEFNLVDSYKLKTYKVYGIKDKLVKKEQEMIKKQKEKKEYVSNNLSVAHEIVLSRLLNSRELLMNFKKRPGMSKKIKEIYILSENVYFQDNTNSLMGLLGMSLRVYYDAFIGTFKYPKLGYLSRKDILSPYNIMENYLFGLLITKCRNAIIENNLDPNILIFHNRLEKDLAQEFIPKLVDALARRVINIGQVKLKDFDNGLTPQIRILLNDIFEKKLQTTVTFPKVYPAGITKTYEECIFIQAQNFKLIQKNELEFYRALRNRG